MIILVENLLIKRKKLCNEYNNLLKNLENMEEERIKNLRKKEKEILSSSLFYKILFKQLIIKLIFL